MKGFVFLFMMLCCLCGFVAAEKNGPKVFVSVDMEGIWGVVHSDQVSGQGQDYGQARKWMADDFIQGFKLMRALIALAAYQ